MISEQAFAKINLTLHVTGQRGDGYHLLDSLVVFADIGDTVSVANADGLNLAIDGPFAADLTAEVDNLVLRAARLLAPNGGATIRLTKRLPIASGIGGGSADAAATLRALSRLWARPVPGVDVVARLGADVPACLHGRPLRLRGIGDVISDLPALPALDILLVNPGIAVSTPEIFKRLTQKTNPAMASTLPDWPDAGACCAWLAEQRNDLLPAATALTPEINRMLTLIRETDCLFAGMSGSGATCFGLYLPGQAKAAQAHVNKAHPDWWAAQGRVI